MPVFFSASMNKPVYIRSARALCGQDTFSGNRIPGELVNPVNNALYYQHPEYSRYFSIMQLRRMSRLTRTGMVTAIECLKDAEISHPDAIITGTGKGSLSDTEKFMHTIREFQEGTLNPTPFIQSTYNSLNGLIGLHHGTSCYNTTYVHRGFSLEHALTDAFLLFGEARASNILVGSFEEMTPEHYIIKKKLGYWKEDLVGLGDLLKTETAGSISGEGTFFFLLQDSKRNAMARLDGIRILFEPALNDLSAAATGFLAEHGLQWTDIDLFITGENGDNRFLPYYNRIAAEIPAKSHRLAFKHICGEFDTAAGFALWQATQVLSEQEIPEISFLRKGSVDKIRRILIYNNYYGKQHAFYLLGN